MSDKFKRTLYHCAEQITINETNKITRTNHKRQTHQINFITPLQIIPLQHENSAFTIDSIPIKKTTQVACITTEARLMFEVCHA